MQPDCLSTVTRRVLLSSEMEFAGVLAATSLSVDGAALLPAPSQLDNFVSQRRYVQHVKPYIG